MSKETPPPQESQERPSFLTMDAVINKAKETLLKYHWHKPTIILEGSIKTITGGFRELLPDFSVQLQQMYDAGLAIGKNEDVGVVEQVFLVSEFTVREIEENECIEIKTSQKELLQVTHCHISSKVIRTQSYEIAFDNEDKVIGFRDFADEASLTSIQDKNLINSFLIGYLRFKAR